MSDLQIIAALFAASGGLFVFCFILRGLMVMIWGDDPWL